MKNKPINIKQLAQKLNLSTSTVSRAFRNNSDINPLTKELILTKAKELNYHPNFYASSLRDKKTKTIAVILPELANNFFSQAVKGIEQVASEKGYHTLIYVTDSDFKKEVSIVENLSNGRVDGIIMSASGEGVDHRYINRLKEWHIPVVFFDRVYDDINAPKVITNDYESSFLATEHLIKSGCRKIALLVIDKALSIGKVRMDGYKDALQKHNIQLKDEWVVDCSNDFNISYEVISTLLSTIKPDGLLATVERLAINAYHVCQDKKIAIPKNVKIISYSSLEIAALLNPSLSTITQPALDMGKKAATLLFDSLRKPLLISDIEPVILESAIIPRNSTGI